jgi:hypothetical protein
MKTFIAFLLWCILLVLCWPLALVMIVIFPLLWLILLPFKLLGLSLDILFSLVKAMLLFPFKAVGAR